MGMKERRRLREHYERDSFGNGGRTAVKADGKPTASYFAMLEEIVAGLKAPFMVKKKKRWDSKKQTTIFDVGAAK